MTVLLPQRLQFDEPNAPLHRNASSILIEISSLISAIKTMLFFKNLSRTQFKSQHLIDIHLVRPKLLSYSSFASKFETFIFEILIPFTLILIYCFELIFTDMSTLRVAQNQRTTHLESEPLTPPLRAMPEQEVELLVLVVLYLNSLLTLMSNVLNVFSTIALIEKEVLFLFFFIVTFIIIIKSYQLYVVSYS